jgi:Uncharacterized protein conserved in bacteria
MLISQIKDAGDKIAVLVRQKGEAPRVLRDVPNVRDLALAAIRRGMSLGDLIETQGLGEAYDPEILISERRYLPPLTHPDPAHLYLTGTGLTHLGSAAARDGMHAKEMAQDATDSMKMFRMGLEGGKPAAGEVGVQPEWFYKGNGNMLAAPETPLISPSFALDGGEEPEIAGLYVISDEGRPYRLGFTLANEFSDHVTERGNYLWLAHSKLRPAAIGPELRIGAAPADIRGTSRILRNGAVIWEKPFLSGEANMSHSLSNLEYHHFKYGLFQKPGDVHVHMFGTATLSFADQVRTEPGDIFEISAEGFGLPLRNRSAVEPAQPMTELMPVAL